MASAKTFDELLNSSDIDESAVSALVGSLDSELDAKLPRADQMKGLVTQQIKAPGYKLLNGQPQVRLEGGKPSGFSPKSMGSQTPGLSLVTVTNPSVLPPGVQILNMNAATRFSQKSPRGIVMGGPVRIAPQLLRQGTPVQGIGQSAIALPPGMRSAIVVRADGSQYQIFNVAQSPGLQATPNATYRLQSLPGTVPAGLIRTLSHQQVVSVPVSSAPPKTLQSPVVQPTTVVTASTLQKVAQQLPVSSAILPVSSSSVVTKTSSNSTSAMSPNTIKKKCQNFLSTLIRLAGDSATKTASNVKKLIQNLIDGIIEPEEFSTQLQKELQSNHQPYLIHFLKKSLPHVRQALMSGEMTIEGIRPPPPTSVNPTQVSTLRFAPTLQRPNSSPLTAQLAQPPTILAQRFISPQQLGARQGLVESSPATVGALQSKVILPKVVSIIKPKEKKSYVSVKEEDDINDVAAMGGVNLLEESQRILATNSELVGAQIRSCKDDPRLRSPSLHQRIAQIANKHGFCEVRADVVALVAHATECRLKDILERLSVIVEHRNDNPKVDEQCEVSHDVRGQIKFLEELDRLEKKRHEDQEKEMLLKAAKSRSKLEDPELLKLKQKAKEMQRAEIEELRQHEANVTALLAIGPRKKAKLDSPTAQGSSSDSIGSSILKPQIRPRLKRVTLRDLHFVMENDPMTLRRPLLYKSYAK